MFLYPFIFCSPLTNGQSRNLWDYSQDVVNIGIQKALWKITIITTKVEHTALLSALVHGIKENAPICCWKVEMCPKETTQPEWWNQLWTGRSCVCRRQTDKLRQNLPDKQGDVKEQGTDTTRGTRGTGSPQTDFLWGFSATLEGSGWQ